MSRVAPLPLGWTVALGAAGALAVLAVLPPVLGGDAGAFFHHAFAAVCHQIPERSLHVAGEPIALCHRCFGILAGLVAGIAVMPGLGRRVAEAVTRSVQPGWLLAAAVPTALDWALGAADIWANTAASRLMTGAVFGLVAGFILAANLLAPSRATSLSPTSSS